MKEIAEEVLIAFTKRKDGSEQIPEGTSIESLNGGLINHTYKVSCPLHAPFLLQRINKNVFADPQHVQENYLSIWQYAEFEFTGLRIPAPRYCGRMATLFVDQHENYWRAFEFIDEAKMLVTVSTPAQAKATAKAFAKFTAAFEEFNVGSLHLVIPGFHDLSARYEKLVSASGGEWYERVSKALSLIDQLKQRERYKHFYEIIIESDEFPLRVMHHDAKIANILFSQRTGRVICPVDFDTVMPGYFFSDIGDMIRSMVCPLDENSTDLDAISIRKDFYTAIMDGYLSVMQPQLTASEIKYIHYAGILMTYMQAIRFLTDYLEGDIYYRIDTPEQNLNRANNQLVLLKRLEEFLEKEFGVRL